MPGVQSARRREDRVEGETRGSRLARKLQIEIVKRADGAGALRCTRDDGLVTWQKQPPRHGAYFALHDLTHFAVETTLGFRSGFFGWIAQGWDVDDTTGKGSRGALPPEAAVAECIVGLFDGERACGRSWTLAEFREFASPGVSLTEDQIERVRARRAELFERWFGVAVGGALSLDYD